MHLNTLAVPAVLAPAEKHRENCHQRDPRKARAIDLKVQDLVSLRVSLPRVKESSLLATAVDPTGRMVPSGETNHRVEWTGRRKKKEPRHLQGSSPYFPIGLRRTDSHPWFNALMQFLLFLPTYREILSYIPKSLQPIKELGDRYLSDIEMKKAVSSADGSLAAACLISKFPNLFRDENLIVNLDAALQLLWTSASLRSERPSWHLLWDMRKRGEELFAEENAVSAFEWLVGLKQLYEAGQAPFQGNCLQRHYLVKQTSLYMEMDAFIEARPDEGKRVAYFAYLKVGGTWVQCADEKISKLKSSRSLEMPLLRGVLFHFRRVAMRYTQLGPAQNCEFERAQ